MSDYTKTPLIDIITSMDNLEKEINFLEQTLNEKISTYEELRLESVRRFPPLEKEEPFKQKQLVKVKVK